jgi:flagellar biosynthesis chaperone FliJ
MAGKQVYPLKEIIDIKVKRVEDQEKVVKEKREALEKEKEKLAQCEEERDKVKKHYQSKLDQMREEMDHGTTSPKIQQMKAYIKVVQQQVKTEEKKVKDQLDRVDLAEKNLKIAEDELKLKRLEVDKLKTHRQDWEKEVRKELEIIEGREQDELGSITFATHHHRRH